MRKTVNVQFQEVPIDYYTWQEKQCGYAVYGHYMVPENSSSVLAGQPMKQLLECYDSVEELHAEYPDAKGSHPLMEPDYGKLPDTPPADFDPLYAGERWHEDDY